MYDTFTLLLNTLLQFSNGGMRNQERCEVFIQVPYRRRRSYHPDIPIWPDNNKSRVICIDTKSPISSTAHSLGDVGIIKQNPKIINDSVNSL